MHDLTIINTEIVDLRTSLPPSLLFAVERGSFEFSRRRVTLTKPISHDDRGQIGLFLSMCERALTPAPIESLQACFGLMATIYTVPAGDGPARKVRLGAYRDALKNLPEFALHAACRRHIESSKFYPRPVELRILAEQAMGPTLGLRSKLQALSRFEIVIDDPRAPRPKRTDEQIAAMRESIRKAFHREVSS